MTAKSIIPAAATLVLLSASLPNLSALDGKGPPSENAPFLLEQKYSQESNPKTRVKIAIDLTGMRLKQLRYFYDEADYENVQKALEQYLAAVDLLGQAVTSASDLGYSKRAEIHFRQQTRELENLKMSLSVMDRADVEKAAEQVTSLRESILYGIMNPRED